MNYDPLKDGISSVELLDNMGDDLMVVNAARVSMAKTSGWDFDDDDPIGGVILKDADKRLINYLAKHKHWTPFSHPQVQLRIKMPIFIARQWFKHMIGFTRNEVSRRYVDDTPELYIPTEWRKRAESVKQGSSDELVDMEKLTYTSGDWFSYQDYVGNVERSALHLYKKLLIKGVCPEQARMVLPQSMYTEFIETGSLAAYARLASLRLDPHAQKEVRQYAEAIDSLMEQLYPVSWAALKGAA